MTVDEALAFVKEYYKQYKWSTILTDEVRRLRQFRLEVATYVGTQKMLLAEREQIGGMKVVRPCRPIMPRSMIVEFEQMLRDSEATTIREHLP